MQRICVIGMWHLGCVTAACLSKWNQVRAYDPDPRVIKGLKEGKPPIFEPGLQEALGEGVRKGALEYSNSILDAAKWADCLYFTFDIPVDSEDRSDLSVLFEAFERAIPAIESSKTIIISSQVPAGTCRILSKKLQEAGKKANLAYVPENLRLGTAIKDFFHPPRLVIGGASEQSCQAAIGLFKDFECKKLSMGLESAEMAKHTLNSYLALLISFSGEISDLCEKNGADARKVMEALLCEPRVSPFAPIMPGLGFGGGTLARDLQSLRAIGKSAGVPTVVLDSAYNANQHRKDYIKRRLKKALGGLEGKTVAFLGLTYKPNTDTLRRSLALEIMESLRDESVRLLAYDPSISELPEKKGILLCASAEDCFKGTDAVVITTAWEEFLGLDYARLSHLMRNPVIIDARNALASSSIPDGVKYFGVGVSNEG